MTRRTGESTLALPPRGPTEPAGRWLYDALRAAILAGRMRAGTRLPSTRDLAEEYGLSRGTVVAAFEQLKAEGYLEAVVGSGTRVVATLPETLLQAPRPPGSRKPPRPPARQLSAFGRRLARFDNFPPGPVRAFRTNQPALDLFPTTLWAQLAARRFRRATVSDLLACEAGGYRPLRDAVAEYLTASRGVHCDPGQVLMVNGAQEALDLVARLLLDPGSVVALEDPGYTGARLAFEAAGAAVNGVPVDAEGMMLPPAVMASARLVYVTPAHQFPTGVAMSLQRRLAMLEWARDARAVIFEDDYDSEFRYASRPLPALQGLATHGQVILAGTFSKVLFPSLRLGYLVVPDDLVDRFEAALSVTRRHAPLLEQAVLADFMAAGHFGRHLRRMREIYAARLEALMDAARERLGGLLEVSPVEAGLQTVGWLRDGIGGDAAAEAARAREVEVRGLARYYHRRAAREGLLLGFGAVDEAEIRRGVRELAAALEQVRRRR